MVSGNRRVLGWVLGASAVLSSGAANAAPPAGFVEQEIPGPWSEASGLEWGSDGRMYVVERSGRVWLVENGVKSQTPFIDLASEVGGWRDYGLLGFALHPNFDQNGFVYLYYVVDHYHLSCETNPAQAKCTPYNPATNEYFQPTIGRITRYTADPATGRRTVMPASRRVLLGETISTGVPILHQSHGTGQLVFGEDGTLLASSGDAGSYNRVDIGGQVANDDTYRVQALAEGILRPEEDIGAMRSQFLGSMDGKLLRIDAETGDGLSSNPFYDAANPRSPQSRVWALGLRNPYRFSRKPGTGAHTPAEGDPGVFYLGDVGWGSAEDLHVIEGPGRNLGWPIFEGLTAHGQYSAANVNNLHAPNPLFGVNGCAQQYLYFRNLIVQENRSGIGSWPNPCNAAVQIPDTWTDGAGRTWTYRKFMHTRPPLDWRGSARVATFDGAGNATTIGVGAAGSPVTGTSFSGNAATGGVWYTGSDFPPEWRNLYFFADYGGGWIKAGVFNDDHQLSAVRNFIDPGNAVVFVSTSPTAGGIYYVKWGDRVRKVTYSPGNRAPVASAIPSVQFGPGPLTVSFQNTSSDPENGALTYAWDFGDGTTSTDASPTHVFASDGGGPTAYSVRLTVRDPQNAVGDTTVVVTVDNTPPAVEITSPREGTEYPMDAQRTFDLTADIADAESPLGALECVWNINLHHNNHVHGEAAIHTCDAQAVVTPAGCDGNVYFYRATLSVTDPEGLVTVRSVDLLPDCENDPPSVRGEELSVVQGESGSVDPILNDWDRDGFLDLTTVVVTRQPNHGFVNVDPETGVMTYTHDGTVNLEDDFAYTVDDDDGATSAEANVLVTVSRRTPVVTISAPSDGGFVTGMAFDVAWSVDWVPPGYVFSDVYFGGALVASLPAGAGTTKVVAPAPGFYGLKVALADANHTIHDGGFASITFEVRDADFDGDGVLDLQDAAPANPRICRDLDADTCDDCAVTVADPFNDGPDKDFDGLCNVGDFNGCDVDNGGCDDNATCTPTPGARVCRCVAGFAGNGVSCTSVDVSFSTAGGLKLPIPNDGYDGTEKSMVCQTFEVPALTINNQTYNRVSGRMSVDLALSHSYAGDLTVKVFGPAGDALAVVNRPRSNAADTGVDLPRGDGSDLVETHPIRFVDGAAISAENMGRYLADDLAICRDNAECQQRPNRGSAVTLGSFGGFNSKIANGTWKVCVGDSNPADVGTLESVSFTFRRKR